VPSGIFVPQTEQKPYCRQLTPSSHSAHLHAVQYYFNGPTPRGYGQGHVEKEGGEVTPNNANTTQSWDATPVNLSYLLSYQ